MTYLCFVLNMPTTHLWVGGPPLQLAGWGESLSSAPCQHLVHEDAWPWALVIRGQATCIQTLSWFSTHRGCAHEWKMKERQAADHGGGVAWGRSQWVCTAEGATLCLASLPTLREFLMGDLLAGGPAVRLEITLCSPPSPKPGQVQQCLEKPSPHSFLLDAFWGRKKKTHSE